MTVCQVNLKFFALNTHIFDNNTKITRIVIGQYINRYWSNGNPHWTQEYNKLINTIEKKLNQYGFKKIVHRRILFQQ